jgi:hypothetical protein
MPPSAVFRLARGFSMNWKVVLLLLAVIGVGVWGWYLQREYPSAVESVALGTPESRPAERPAGPSPRSAPQPVAATAQPAVGAPFELDHSDGQVRAAVADIAARFAQWLTPEEQIRKWVILVDQLADGKLPAKDRPLSYPMKTFTIHMEGEKKLLDPSNYTRADALIDAFTAIPVQSLAAYYHAWKPLLEKAYRELGRKGTFEQRLHAALDRVEAVHSPTGQPELVQPVVYFKYADETLEKASDVEKLMWRLGPKNTQKVQDYLHKLEPEL